MDTTAHHAMDLWEGFDFPTEFVASGRDRGITELHISTVVLMEKRYWCAEVDELAVVDPDAESGVGEL